MTNPQLFDTERPIKRRRYYGRRVLMKVHETREGYVMPRYRMKCPRCGRMTLFFEEYSPHQMRAGIPCPVCNRKDGE